jgi:imidazolonepropionase-like amidohydrolase
MGVPLLAGSDAGWRATAFDTVWKELDELVAARLTPVQAVHAATGAPAGVWNCDQTVGAIRAGLRADLLAVTGDVANNVRCLQHVRAVFQAGEQVVPTTPAAIN